MSESVPAAAIWLPNAVTLLRIPLAVAAALAALPGPTAAGLSLLALACFLLAAIGDWLDGCLARRWNAVSEFGALMDPIADKALVWGLLSVFAVRTEFALIVVVPLAIVVIRDTLVTGVRLLGAAQVRTAAKVSWHGKAKTVAQMALVGLPLTTAVFGFDLLQGGWMFAVWLLGLWIVAAYTAITGAGYARAITLAHSAN